MKHVSVQQAVPHGLDFAPVSPSLWGALNEPSHALDFRSGYTGLPALARIRAAADRPAWLNGAMTTGAPAQA